MHFAYPPRKNSHPPPFRPRSSKLPLIRRTRLRSIFIILFTFIVGLFLFTRRWGGSATYQEHRPSGSPPVVIVTMLDEGAYHEGYLKTVRENREHYAKLHGYEVFMPSVHDYDTGSHPTSWARIMATRHAISKYPEAGFIWYLDQNAYIMNPTRNLEDQLIHPRVLETLMIRDYPIVPPDSIIKTFAHLRGEDASFIIGQDNDGLISDSMIIRNGEWAKFLTETWLDPLYRTYNFQKAQRHALEHIVQWHPTILSKIALVPQRTMASYIRSNLGAGYEEGDFIAMFTGCTASGEFNCEDIAMPFFKKWQELIAKKS